jgi:tryptophan 2,3-dioxygenase
MGRVSEEEGPLSYGTYLRVPELLSLQSPLADPPAHDEMLFIIVHQAFELWFKEMLFELESIRDRMFAGDSHRAHHELARVHTIERLLVQQIEVIETMLPQDFLAFRSNLDPASGFQSVQFREIEFLSGLKKESYLHVAETEDEKYRLKRRFTEPSIWDAFCRLLEASGLPMPQDDEEARRTSLIKMARDRDAFPDLFAVSEALVSHDELFSLWRARHVLMVIRQIGSKPGTGGSSGASYLMTTLEKRFYPELWEIRSSL